MSEVTQRLKERRLDKTVRATGFYQKSEAAARPYGPGVKLCLERARLVTQSYKETEGEPMVLRRAKALNKILENMTIYIEPEQPIVGNYASNPDFLTSHPELYWRWLDKLIDDGYRDLLDDRGREELKEIHKYWQGKSVQGMERDYLSDDLKPYWPWNGATFWIHFADHGCPDYDKLFRIGLNGLVKQAEDKSKQIEADFDLPAQEYIEQRDFLKAVIIALNAGISFGKRYAAKARELAKDETDARWRGQLERIAETCDWVPANPPRTFYEALHFFWFIHLITHIIEEHTQGSGARFDQLMYPFYKKDREEGRITREEAQELLEFLWLKFDSLAFLAPPAWGGIQAAVNLSCLLTIGGVTPAGEDATNEMSYIVLDATRAIRTLQPHIGLRYHAKIPKELVFSAIDTMRAMTGNPALFNDGYEIPMLLSLGIPIEDARNYGIESCMAWTIPGKNLPRRAAAGAIVLPKCLELALSNGVDKFSGRQLGAATPDPLTFTSLDQVMDAYLEQVRFMAEKLLRIYNIAETLYKEHLPRIFMSAVIDGCIERAKEFRRWAYFPKKVVSLPGATVVADSLAAMKKLVFEEKRVGMAELLDALKNNWEGKEELRLMFLDQAPKFGNDDDYVDLVAAEVHRRTARVIGSFKTNFGNHFLVDGSAGSTYYAFSPLTGATPDGRKDRELFNDGTVSPVAGRDKKGPTAVLKSTSKVDPLTSWNQLLNQKFLPQFLEGENKELFANYLKTWADLGHHHIQFNIVDKEMLQDAQAKPDKYSDLVVRVAGYCAYFVNLPKLLQDAIIARTEQAFGQ